MGKVLKDKYGNYIVKPVSHPATDDQVRQQLDKLIKDGILTGVKPSVEYTEELQAVTEQTNTNTAEIAGLKRTLESLESDGSETNVLLQYDDNFFGELEHGEIYWADGQDADWETTLYVRSVGYKLINDSTSLLVAKIPSTAAVSYYTYSYEDGVYTWESVSEWLQNGSTFKPSAGKYYRALVYNYGKDITPNDVRIVRTGSLIEDVLSKLNSGTDKALGEKLSASEQLELNTTIETLKSLITPNTAQIAWHTDLHITANELTTTEELIRSNSSGIRKHLTMFNKICDNVKIDALFLGGDYLNNTMNSQKYHVAISYEILREYLEGCNSDIKKAVCVGNHDDNTLHARYNNNIATHYFSQTELWNAFHNLQEDDTQRDTDYLERCYGYYDIPNKKIRAFFLNTVDIPQRVDDNGALNYLGQDIIGYQQEQLQFVADNLVFDQEGWQVIFFQHHPLKDVKTARGGDSMREIMSAFMNQASGTAVCTGVDFESSVAYDFTANKSNTIICCVCGHYHSDQNLPIDGIPSITTVAILEGNSVYFVIDRANRQLHQICNSATASEDKAGSDYIYSY